jgi:hypothetical protein
MFPAYGSMYVQTITERKGSKQKSTVNKEGVMPVRKVNIKNIL